MVRLASLACSSPPPLHYLHPPPRYPAPGQLRTCTTLACRPATSFLVPAFLVRAFSIPRRLLVLKATAWTRLAFSAHAYAEPAATRHKPAPALRHPNSRLAACFLYYITSRPARKWTLRQLPSTATWRPWQAMCVFLSSSWLKLVNQKSPVSISRLHVWSVTEWHRSRPILPSLTLGQEHME